MKSIRTQIDDKGDDYSLATALDCSESRDTTRQEFKEEADVNYLLAKFGVDQQQRTGLPNYGEVDYTLDFQQALNSISESKDAYSRMHPDIKAKYPTWQKMVNAMASGALAEDLEKMGITHHVKSREQEIDDEIAREEQRNQRLRDREAEKVAHEIRTGQAAVRQYHEREALSQKEDKK